jgi:cytosine/adenosine deaminase-related metal-dependent hydrolase
MGEHDRGRRFDEHGGACGGLSRRELLLAGAAGVAALATARRGLAQEEPGITRPLRERVLLRGGTVLTLDPALGDFERADVLLEGARIAAVQSTIEVSSDAVDVIDAAGTIVLPGFIDTHRHMWQGALRNILPDGLLTDYGRDITGAARAVFRPEDARIGDFVSALGALNAGVTTILDWSHIGNSPAHSDAAIEGLEEAGIRAVYAYGAGAAGANNRFPEDIRRLRREHFSSADQLLTLAMAAGGNARDWAVARDVGAFISIHVVGSLGGITPDVMGPDVTYIHCTNLQPETWRAIAATGGHVSIAGPIEMQMNHGVPPIVEALAHGIRPSLSVDVETQQPADMFSQMRGVFALQRMLSLERQRAGAADAPPLLSVRDMVELATLRGAMANQLERKCGSLTPGKDADVLMLRADAINVLPLNNAYGAVVLGMDTSNVDTVFVAGQLRKRAGRLVGVDVERVRRDAERSRDYVLAEIGWPQTVLGGYLPGH